ncbi:hypothetical protein JCM19992_30360 [Thermostilla marina]
MAIVLSTVVAILLPERGALADANGDLAAARASIAQADLMRGVAYLASDELEGREAGTSGGRRAGDWIAARLTELGLTPAGTEGYFQPFGNDYRNVLAYLPGSDSQVGEEIIVVSAHYDHIGYGTKKNTRDGPGKIHNGADDNASGTSTVLELAEALMQLPSPPRRSYLFALWDAEEKGLLGSKHWVENPTLPLERVKLNVNVDMVGRLRDAKLYMYGTRTAAGLRSLAARANRDNALELLFSWRYRRDSDHYSFCRHGTPALLVHTGLHDDYHSATDDPDKINAAGMELIGRMLFDVLIELDAAEELPDYRPAAEKESDAVFKSLIEAPARWRGRLKVRVQADDGNGVIVVGTDPDSPLEKAGIRPGDRIRKLGKFAIQDPIDLTAAGLLVDREVGLVYEREGEAPRTVTIVLEGEPVRLGIQWKPDDAEPHAALVTGVLPHSPAARLGIEPGDYVLEVAGTPLESASRLPALVRAAGESLSITWEHNGRIHRAPVPKPGEPTSDTVRNVVPRTRDALRGELSRPALQQAG